VCSQGNFVLQLFPKSSKQKKVNKKGELSSHQSKVGQKREPDVMDGKS
jgi:hypothetical protein